MIDELGFVSEQAALVGCSDLNVATCGSYWPTESSLYTSALRGVGVCGFRDLRESAR